MINVLNSAFYGTSKQGEKFFFFALTTQFLLLCFVRKSDDLLIGQTQFVRQRESREKWSALKILSNSANQNSKAFRLNLHTKKLRCAFEFLVFLSQSVEWTANCRFFFNSFSIWKCLLHYTLFGNYSKCRVWILALWQFQPIFVLLKLICLVTLFDRKL